MPVLITGATGMVGRALAARLLDEGAHVRAYLRREDAALRAAGVHVAIGAVDDVERLESALTRVHTLVHLVGGAWPERGVSYDRLNRESTEVAAIAARGADVRRLVFLSALGADPDSRNEFLAAKGRAEDHVRSAGCEFAILRCAPILAPGSLVERFLARARRGPVTILPGSGDQRWTPAPLDRVVDAIVAADDRAADVRGIWEVGGTEEVTLDVLAGGGRTLHLGIVPGVPTALSDWFARDLVADGSGLEHLGVA